MQQDIQTLKTIAEKSKIIPVVIINDWKKAVPLALNLINNNIYSIEVTLRTADALEAIKAIRQEIPEMAVGAGTILQSNDFENAYKAGAQFIVSPGFHTELAKRAFEMDVALLPGAVTPTELMTALTYGYSYLKFFPAMQSGGLAYIKALASPFAQCKFCPTGGITEDLAQAWLSLPNVFCLGGSWIAPAKLIDEENFEEIGQRAQTAARLIAP